MRLCNGSLAEELGNNYIDKGIGIVYEKFSMVGIA
jgi:hypothetical protein